MKEWLIACLKKGTPVVLCFFFVFCTCFREQQASAGENETKPSVGTLHAYAAVLYDGEAGRVLYEKNGYEFLPMASTTKIMTLLVVLENSEPSEIVTVSKNAAKQPDVQLNINTGEQYYVKDLCYSLMLESHNDTAVALAEHVGGSVEGFAEMMNAKAKSLGAFNANFVTPNGLDAEGHGITAADLAKIAAYAVKRKEFRDITNTSSYSFSEINKKRQFTVNNKNAFLTMMDGAVGVKTGFTGKAGYCFVGAVEKEDRLLISVVLASGWPPNKTYKWSDTKKLMNYGLEAFEKKHPFEDIHQLPVLKELPVKEGQKESIKLCYEAEGVNSLLEKEILMAEGEEIKISIQYDKTGLNAPISAGYEVGSLVLELGDETIKKIPIKTAEAISSVDFLYCFRKVTKSFFSAKGQLP